MAGATGRQVHVDKTLSQMALNYKPEGFIADQIMPVVTVNKQSDVFASFSRADRLRQQDTRRTPGVEAHRIDQSVSSGTYYAPNYALKMAVTIEDKANADPIYLTELYNGKAEFIMDHLLLDYEIRVVNQVTSGSNVGSFSAVASAWSLAGDPLGDVNQGIDNVEDSNGVRGNRVVFGLSAWRSFRRDSNIRNIIFGANNGGGYPNTSQVAALLDVPTVLVGGGFQNTGAEGQAESLSQLWNDNVLIYYTPDRPTTQRPSAFYSFRWVAPGLPNFMVERHPYDSRKHAEEVEVGYYQAEVITGASYAFLLNGVNSSQ